MSKNFIFRSICPEETTEAIAIEQACFPPHEACSKEHMTERIEAASDLFLVAVNESTGKIAGSLNGIATNESCFRDEFFTDISLNYKDGKNIMLLGLSVLPEYRGQGLARELVRQYAIREQKNGREMLFLTCLEEKIPMYLKFGFVDKGIANSVWGGEIWHEMSLAIPVCI